MLRYLSPMAGVLNDVFDEESDADIATSEWNHLCLSRTKDGYRNGYEAGQEISLQAGFNQGYCEAVKFAYKVNYLKGLLSALKANHEHTEHHAMSTTDKEAIKDMLQELELLEQSQHAMLKSSTNLSATRTHKLGEAGESDVSMLSEELHQMQILHTDATEDVHKGMTMPCVRTDDALAAGDMLLDRLQEISHRCTSLFLQLDIQNVSQ